MTIEPTTNQTAQPPAVPRPPTGGWVWLGVSVLVSGWVTWVVLGSLLGEQLASRGQLVVNEVEVGPAGSEVVHIGLSMSRSSPGEMGTSVRVGDQRQKTHAALQAASAPLKLVVSSPEGTGTTSVTTVLSRDIAARIALRESGSEPYLAAVENALDGARFGVGIAPSGTPPSGSLWQYWHGRVERFDRAPKTAAPRTEDEEQQSD
ncbi:MAG TPA: hypothetical protein DCZ72_11630 [Armatimonadetes bacterium]|nr:hypothetical protein [Armatimonadota bacterium]